MAGVLNLFRKHPKKIIFFTGACIFSYDYGKRKYSDEILRRAFCAEVKSHGKQLLVSPIAQLDRLTVFLNPFSRRGDILKQFEKNVAPILQMSGLDVQMVYTDTDIEVKDHARNLDLSDTDGILLVGDDNLLQKAITGILEKTDGGLNSTEKIPVGIVPLGIWNVFARSLSASDRIVEWCFDLLHPIVTKQIKRRNVLCISEVSDVEPSADSQTNRKVHAMSGLEWSIWRDLEHNGGCGAPKRKSKPIDINDHRGVLLPVSLASIKSPFRNIGTFWRHTMYWLTSTANTRGANEGDTKLPTFFSQNDSSSSSSPNHTQKYTTRFRTKVGHIVYTPACSGCSKCWHLRQENASTVVKQSPPLPRSSLSRLLGVTQPRTASRETGTAVVSDPRCSIENPHCQQEIRVEVDNYSGVTLTLEDDHIRVDLLPAATGYLEHIRQSRRWLQSLPYSKVPDTVDATHQEIVKPGEAVHLNCSSVRLYPAVLHNEYFWIDNDHFEACPVDVRVRFNAVSIYSSNTADKASRSPCTSTS